jgi:hypothetical protein
VNCVETVFELPGTDVAFSDLSAAQPESLPSGAGTAGMVCGTGLTDFSICYARELSSLVWFVMSLGADAHRAADVAGLLGIAALFGSAASTAVGGALAGMPNPVHVAALAPHGMPHP